ncbi:hypothetical protein [Pseudoalteromonas umbrosa]|uniref:hypothetical protein n=1 Tax=Pseudoalteromonas umbrosa TaxID=3048489 RepID=UPI0024C42D0C|nr:hypothetical protein [Pseudoalteromonas sp. B95]MDK1290137.1 hypothetical protein [Pseudoalteromonas sp. B95]
MKALFTTSIVLMLSAFPALAEDTIVYARDIDWGTTHKKDNVAVAASQFSAYASSQMLHHSVEQFADEQSVTGQRINFSGGVSAQLSGASKFSKLEGKATAGLTSIDLSNLVLTFDKPVRSFGFKAVDVNVGSANLDIQVAYQDGTSATFNLPEVVHVYNNLTFWGIHADKAIKSVSIDRTDVQDRVFLDEFVVIGESVYRDPTSNEGLIEYITDSCQVAPRDYMDENGAVAIKTPLGQYINHGHIACTGSLKGGKVSVIRASFSANRFLGNKSTDWCFVRNNYRNVTMRISPAHWGHEVIDGQKVSTMTIRFTHSGQFPHKPYGYAATYCRFADPQADNMKLIGSSYSVTRDTF